jgi:hypothetical protein
MRRRIVILVLAFTTALATGCTNDDDGGDPVLEDGQVQPGEE